MSVPCAVDPLAEAATGPMRGDTEDRNGRIARGCHRILEGTQMNVSGGTEG